MGEDHPQEIARCLTQWHALAEREVAALREGDFEALEELIQETVRVRTRLDGALAAVDPHRLRPEIRTLMEEIFQIQEALMQEMQKGAAILGEKIDTVRKNTASLRGYKPPAPPVTSRFLNKRT